MIKVALDNNLLFMGNIKLRLVIGSSFEINIKERETFFVRETKRDGEKRMGK